MNKPDLEKPILELQPTYHHQQKPPRFTRAQKRAMLIGVGLGLIIAVTLLAWRPWQASKSPEPEQPVQQESVEAELVEEPEEEPEKIEVKAEFNAKKIDKTLDGWISSHSGVYAVTITDKNGKVLASSKSSRSFFAASIYKIFVAYEGYKKIDSGEWKLTDKYVGSWDRERCLHEMIYSSNSPCSEKMRAEIGATTIDKKLPSYSINDTSIAAVTTTSGDSAKMLARIYSGEGLSASSRKKYLESMKTQIYRKALPAGFVNQTVYDKVGFYEQKEYHDTAIVKYKDGRILIVSVLTENVGTTNIAGLGAAIANVTK